MKIFKIFYDNPQVVFVMLLKYKYIKLFRIKKIVLLSL